MATRGPRIVLIGRSYLALCVLERLLERGETVAAFVGQEGQDKGGERDFCDELSEICSRQSIPARSARKLGEEAVRWLEDRIRPELAISVGTSFDIPLAIGGNIRLGLVELWDSGSREQPRRVGLRQRGQELVSVQVPEPVDEEDENLVAADALLELLENHLDTARRPGTTAEIPYHGAALGEEELQGVSADPEPGARTDALEGAFADYVEGSSGLAVTSVARAFEALFAELGIGEADEVVCPAIASRAAIDALLALGARPVFADVQPGCLTLDPERIGAAITPRTRALLIAHPWGQPAELDALYGAAAEAGIEVVEDATAALGARFEQSRIGRSPCAAVFRMPLAPLSPGTAPALIALPDPLDARMRARLAGERIGDGIAAIAAKRLRDWDAKLSAQSQVALRYSSELARYDAFRVPGTPAGRLPTYSDYPLRLTRFSRTSAEDLHKLMADSGVETRMIQLSAEAQSLADLPVADRLRGETLLLPCHPQLDEEATDLVLDALFGYAIG
jgi:dTDP-4-amino-4,6-dideoxygalactose transaminase